MTHPNVNRIGNPAQPQPGQSLHLGGRGKSRLPIRDAGFQNVQSSPWGEMPSPEQQYNEAMARAAAQARLSAGSAQIGAAGARTGVASANLGQGSARIGAIGANVSLHGARAMALQQLINQQLALLQEERRQARTIDQTGYGAFSRIVGY